MGQIVTIGSGDGTYKYELPPLPNEKDILYFDLPKHEQYWRSKADLKNQLDIKDVKKMSERERIEYISTWRNRWKDGMWFMNFGEPTFITGAHIDHLVFNKFGGVNLYYLESQRERFYFRDLTNKDRICDGRVWVKARRTGITTEQITETIRVVLSDFNNKVAMQSTKLEICQRTLMRPIIDTYISRPKWMREEFYKSNGKKPINSLRLTTSVLDEDGEQPLNGAVFAFPTVSSAIDGDGWMLIVGDEKSKWTTASPYETMYINKKAIVNPGKRGKLDILSTTGDAKEAESSVVDWHKIISESNPTVRNPNGKTNSGLYKYFVSGIHSLDLTEELPGILDKYGRVDKDRAEEYLWNEINNNPKDSKAYIYALYKTPMEERHALLNPSNASYFSKIRITHRLDSLRKMPNTEKPYVRGRLEENQDGTIRFEQDEYGHWLIALHPYFSEDKGIDTRNRYTKQGGVHFPPVNPEYAGGYDPIRYRKEDTTSNSLSKAAIIIGKLHDYYGSGESNQFAALYLYRPDDPRDANKEAIKACKYYGCKMMHEKVIESVKEDFIESGMLPFLSKNDKDGHYGIWIDSQGKVVKNAVESMVTRFAPPKEGEQDQIDIMPFEECLVDMDSFDVSNTTRFDVFMAMIEFEYCAKQTTFTNVNDNSARNLLSVIHEVFNAPRN